MWIEDRGKSRINTARYGQLAATEVDTVASACPFCLLMLTDAARDPMATAVQLPHSASQRESTHDIAELLAQACELSVAKS